MAWFSFLLKIKKNLMPKIPIKILQFLLSFKILYILYLKAVFPALKLKQNCYIEMKTTFS